VALAALLMLGCRVARESMYDTAGSAKIIKEQQLRGEYIISFTCQCGQRLMFHHYFLSMGER